MKRIQRASTWSFLLVTACSMTIGLYMAFLYAPDEAVMGAVQRIFYFHEPIAIVTFASVFVLLIASIAYLWTRERRWEWLSLASTEIGLLMCTLVLVTGPIWAKAAWGVWWTWEAKLTTTLILWLLLAGCLLVRGYSSNPDQAARLAAVLGVVSALDVPIIYKAVDWWRGNHPVVFGPGKQDALDPAMRDTFLVCLLAFFLLYGVLVYLRTRLAELEERSRNLAETFLER